MQTLKKKLKTLKKQQNFTSSMKPIKLASLIKEEPLQPNSGNEQMENDNTYMFFQNLKTMHHAITHMLEMPADRISQELQAGHGWALDHIATSADDIEEVYHFLTGKILGEAQVGTPSKSNVGTVKVGSIVIPKAGPHKGIKHRVIHVNGPKINIKPILPKISMNRYKLGAASTTTNMVDIYQEENMNEAIGAFRRLIITTAKLDTVKQEIEDFIKRPNIKTDYPDMKISIKPGAKPNVLVVDVEAISGTALANKISDVAKKFDKAANIKVRKELKLKPVK